MITLFDGAVNPAGVTCTHFVYEFFRFRIRDGRYQVRQLSCDCGHNLRGPGVNVPFAEAERLTGRPVAELPVWAGARPRQNGGQS